MDLQDNLPSQAAGGYDKDLGSTLRAALIRWEKNAVYSRNSNSGNSKMKNETQVRSSALPKLAVCGQFEGARGEPSEAATRGLRLDSALRELWHTMTTAPLEQSDAIPVHWAYGVLESLTCNPNSIRYSTEMREENCKIWVPIIDYTGTADAICVSGRWVADLKSGQVRNYREQMAAYCLGLMTQHLETQWTYHLIFCDEEKIVSETLTFAEARAIVQGVVDKLGTAPVENEYCGWCAKSLTCSARVGAKDSALAEVAKSIAPDSPAFLELLNDPERLGKFLDQCSTFDAFWDAAKERARQTIEIGGSVPGYRLQRGRTTETVSVETQDNLREHFSALALMQMQGPISAKKFRELVGAGVEFPVETKTSKPSLVKSK